VFCTARACVVKERERALAVASNRRDSRLGHNAILPPNILSAQEQRVICLAQIEELSL
jgi:hypothetical protein